VIPPQAHLFDTLWGHDRVRALFPRLLGAARLPHAILLTGPNAIGKRSLAFALAKAVLSVGRPLSGITLSAPGPAPAKRKIPDDEPGDMFGGGEAEEDLFASPDEPDLFGDPTPPPPSPPLPSRIPSPPSPPLPSLIPPRPSLIPQTSSLPFPSLIHPPYFVGYDDRVCRLVEKSYPVEWDKDMRPSNAAHMDLTIIEPAGGRRSIVVDQVRFLQDIATVPPIEGTHRVVMILGADTITQEAGNCILKLLEEPPSYLIMILVADRLSSVLPTIRSRCSVLPMGPLPREVLVDMLVEREKLDPELAKVAAALSEGRPGVALSAIQGSLLERRRQVFDARLQIDRFGTCAIAAAADRIAGGGKFDESLWLLLSFTRDRLVRACAPDHPDLLVHGDAMDLIDSVTISPALLDEEADRLVAATRLLAHPYLPNDRAALQMALWA